MVIERRIGEGVPYPEHDALLESYRRLKAQLDRDPSTFKEYAALYPRRPADLVVKNVEAGGVPAEWVSTPGADKSWAIFYLHGGGFTEGSPRSHRELVGRISRTCGIPALVPEYRLAPANPFPAALDDALSAYRWLATQTDQIVVMGDSAGGGLAVSLMTQLGETDVKPRAAGLASPWLDLTATNLTPYFDDPFVSEEDLRYRAGLYANGLSPEDPRLSPLFADLKGLPPLIVQAGESEMLLNDSVRFSKMASSAGVHVELEIWAGMSHVWHQWGAAFPTALSATTALALKVCELAGWVPTQEESI